jgi:glycosyltransferase involved in cell wall biosynthesis
MLKVANVIEDGRVAGPQLRILAVSAALQTKNVRTTVVHPQQESDEFARRLDHAGVAHTAISIQRLTRGTRAVFRYLALFPADIYRLWRFFRQNRFDLVHCSGGYWQVKGLIGGRLAGCQVIWHLNDTVMPKPLRPLFFLAARCFADGLIFAGRRVRDHYLGGRASPVPAFEVQAPVNCEKFDPNFVSPNSDIVRYGGIKIVTISNLNPLKGIEYFLQMALILRKEFDAVTFHIVGPMLASQAQYISRLKQFIHENSLEYVYFHGRNDDIAGILKAADIYVCSSLAEASPTSVWEAMAMEKAIVSTDVGDVGRFIREGLSGFVVSPKDPVALADSVARFIRDPALRQACGQAARRTAIESLDLELCVRNHQKAYGTGAGETG